MRKPSGGKRASLPRFEPAAFRIHIRSVAVGPSSQTDLPSVICYGQEKERKTTSAHCLHCYSWVATHVIQKFPIAPDINPTSLSESLILPPVGREKQREISFQEIYTLSFLRRQHNGWSPNMLHAGASNNKPVFSFLYISNEMQLYTIYLFLENCSIRFGWYFHPSSGAHITVFTVSGTC